MLALSNAAVEVVFLRAGLRNAMLTATKGTAVLNTIFREYAAWCGDILTRENGSLIGHETGQACP